MCYGLTKPQGYCDPSPNKKRKCRELNPLPFSYHDSVRDHMPIIQVIVPNNQFSCPAQLYLPVLQLHRPSQLPGLPNTHNVDGSVNWSVIEQLNVSTVWKISNFCEAEVLYEMSQVFPKCLDELILLGHAQPQRCPAEFHVPDTRPSSLDQNYDFQLNDLIRSMLEMMQLPTTCVGNVWSTEYLIELMLLYFNSQDCLMDVSMGTGSDPEADTSIPLKFLNIDELNGDLFPVIPAIVQKSLDLLSFHSPHPLLRENQFVRIIPVYERGTRWPLNPDVSKVTFSLDTPDSYAWLTWNTNTCAFEGTVPLYSPLERLERGEAVPNFGCVGPYVVTNVIRLEIIATLEEPHALSHMILKRTVRTRLTFKVIPWYSDWGLVQPAFGVEHTPETSSSRRNYDAKSIIERHRAYRNPQTTSPGSLGERISDQVLSNFVETSRLDRIAKQTGSLTSAHRRRLNRTSLYHDDILDSPSIKSRHSEMALIQRATLPSRLKVACRTLGRPALRSLTPQTTLPVRHYKLPIRNAHGSAADDPSASDTCNPDSRVSHHPPKSQTPQTTLPIRQYRPLKRNAPDDDLSTSDTCNTSSRASYGSESQTYARSNHEHHSFDILSPRVKYHAHTQRVPSGENRSVWSSVDSIDWQSGSSQPSKAKRRRSLIKTGLEMLTWAQSAERGQVDKSETNVNRGFVEYDGSDTPAPATSIDHRVISAHTLAEELTYHYGGEPAGSSAQLNHGIDSWQSPLRSNACMLNLLEPVGDMNGTGSCETLQWAVGDTDSASESCILDVGSRDADLISSRRQANIWETMARNELEQAKLDSVSQATQLGACCADCTQSDYTSMEDGADTKSAVLNEDTGPHEPGVAAGAWQCLRSEVYQEPSRDRADSDATLGLQSDVGDVYEEHEDRDVEMEDAPILFVPSHAVINGDYLPATSNHMSSQENDEGNDSNTETTSSHTEDEVDVGYLVNFGC